MESDQNDRKGRRQEAENAAAETAVAVAVAMAMAVAAILPLPDEIVQNILLRLPVKCLLRFKSVCKQWRALISDPHFVKSQLKHTTTMMNPYRRMCALMNSPANSNSVCLTSLDLVSSSSYDIKLEPSSEIHIPFREPAIILGSSNGLFLVLECSLYEALLWKFEALLWNACTGEYKYIPGTSHLFEDYLSRPNSRIVDFYIAGFGYDSSVGDYKSVIIFHDKIETSYLRVFIFTCRTGSWVEISNYRHHHGFPYLIPFSFPGITLNNEAPYWIVQRDNNINNGPCDCDLVIIYFDWSEKRVKEVPLPDDSTLISRNFFTLAMVDLCGCICIVDHSRNSHIDVWVMKEHGIKDSWTKLFVFPKSNPSDFLRPLGLTKNGEVLLLISKKRLIIYDYNKGKEVVLISVGRPSFLNLTLFMESLVSPDGAQGSWTLKQCTKVERERLTK